MALGYGRTSTNNFSTAKFIVDTNGIQNGATHTTIAAAITSAGAGPADIFIRPGTYTENLTDPGNLNFVGYGGGQLQQVQIVGKITQTGAASSTWSNIYFKTNSDNALSIGGSGANQSVFNNCYFYCASTGIAINNSSASPLFRNCVFSQRTASTAHFSITSAGQPTFNYCTFLNDSGGADGTNTVASGSVQMSFCRLSVQYTTSSTGSYFFTDCIRLTSGNSTFLTTAGTGTTYLANCTLQSGTSATISVGSGTTVVAYGLNIISSNSNPITGAGTFTSSPVIFSSTGYGINVTSTTLNNIDANAISFDKGATTCYTGSWTPTFTSSGGGESLSYGTRFGYYMVMGNMVYFHAVVNWSAKSGGSGEARVNLPFTATSFYILGSVQTGSFTSTTEPRRIQTISSSTSCKLLCTNTADDRDAIGTIVNFSSAAAAGGLYYWGTYVPSA